MIKKYTGLKKKKEVGLENEMAGAVIKQKTATKL